MRVELKLQDKIISYLEEHRIWHLRYNASVTYGLPDVFALYKGYFIGIEIKREDGEGVASILQTEVIESIKENGGLSTLVDNLGMLHNLFLGIDKGDIPPEWKN